MRTPTDVNEPIYQEQCQTLILPLRRKRDITVYAASACSRDVSDYRDWAAKLFCATRYIQRVEALYVRPVFFRLCNHIKRASRGVNYRRPGNANLRLDICAADLSVWHRSDAGSRIDETRLPKR